MSDYKKNIRQLLLSFFFLIISLGSIFGQVKNLGLPYYQNYTVEDYKASKQNWAITQDNRGVMYFGNTMGVLEYDGHDWKLIRLTDKDNRVKALCSDENGRIYVGLNKDFGYLLPDSIGKMKYMSISDKIENSDDRNSLSISRIFYSNGSVYFTGEEYIFEYKEGRLTTNRINGLKQTAIVNSRIFTRISKKGLFEWKNNELVLLKNGEDYINSSLRAVLPSEDGFLFVTMEDGLLLYDNEEIAPLKTSIDKFLKSKRIYSAIKLKDGNYALGMRSKGVVIIDKYGDVIQHHHTATGLPNDLVTYIYQSTDGNLWLGTYNGLSYLMSSLPISKYSEEYGLKTATYSSLIKDETLYLGSSFGIYQREWTGKETHLNEVEKFKLFGETTNNWNIDTLNGVILSTTTRSLDEVVGKKVKKVKLETNNFWKVLRVPDEQDLLIVGTSQGLKLLQFKRNKKKSKKTKKTNSKTSNKPEGKWVFKNDIKGYNGKCRRIEIDKNQNVWVSSSTEGILKLVLNEKFDSVKLYKYDEDKGLQNGTYNHFLFNVNNKLVVGTDEGLYFYDTTTDKFLEYEELNLVLGKQVKIWLMANDSAGNIWYKQERKVKGSELNIFEMGELILQDNGSYINYKTPFYKFKNDIYSINPLNNGEVIVGTAKGFIHYDPEIEKDYSKDYKALIRKVECIINDSTIFDGSFADSLGYTQINQPNHEIKSLEFKYNDIRFSFSAPFFDQPEDMVYKFYLEGNDIGWSDWKEKNFKEYSNLLEGEYTFRVVAKNIYEKESSEASYHFIILPPWFRTKWAYAAYVILTILLVWGIVRLSVRRLKKQKEHLEQVVEERTLEIRMKNSELEQQKEEILTQRDEIEEKKDQLERKNKNITASINYAKRIQEAMLPIIDRIEQSFDDSFILFKPRDIVSGDFYWFSEKKGKIILTAVDCTGHGVPGAFMSMIGSEILTTIVNQGITKPSEILDYKNQYVRKALKQDQTDNQDGMDMSLLTIDKQTNTIEWAGAKNPLIYIQDNELFHIKGDMQSIGGHQMIKKAETNFTNHTISYNGKITYCYIFSDGFQDQFGGDKNRKFMIKRLKDLIFENYMKPMEEQKAILNDAVEGWMKHHDQTDDILVIGFKLVP